MKRLFCAVWLLAYAGAGSAQDLAPGHCQRIMTGAAMLVDGGVSISKT